MKLFKCIRLKPSDRERYVKQVQKYFEKNIYTVITAIILLKKTDVIDVNFLKKTFSDSFPRCPLYDDNDYINQIQSLFKVLKVDIDLKRPNKIKNAYRQYSDIVSNYIGFSGANIFDNICKYVENFNNRITYEDLCNILGKHYPKISFAIQSDRRISMLILLNEIGIIFKFDNNFIYLI